MARFRKMLAPINSNKHFVQQAQSTVAAATISTRIVADAVVAPATTNASDVRQGAIIKAVWIELWIIGDGAAGLLNSFNITLEKLPSNLATMAFIDSLALGAYTNKKNILYTTQGIVSQSDGVQPAPIIRQWFKIPQGKQRMGLGDRIVLNISNLIANNLAICGMFIYKEYT